MKVISKNIKDLIHAEYNPRKLSSQAYEDIKSSLLRFGMVDPIIINVNSDRKNIIIGGHQRCIVWKDLEHNEIPAVELDLTLEQEKELNVRLNKNTGAWDWEALSNYFNIDDLKGWGFEADDFPIIEDDGADAMGR